METSPTEQETTPESTQPQDTQTSPGMGGSSTDATQDQQWEEGGTTEEQTPGQQP